MEKTTTKTEPKLNGKLSSGEIQNNAAVEKLKRFLDKEGLAIKGYFQCLNKEVLEEFQASSFCKMKLIAPSVRVVKKS